MADETRPDAGKVLFFPYYFYLHFLPFHRVIRRLNREGIRARLVHMPCNPLDESAGYGLGRIRASGCPVRSLPLSAWGLGSTGFFSRCARLAGLILARSRVRRFLREERPDLVVVGSDLGNAYFRVMLDQCRRLGIGVLILATVSSGSPAAGAPAESDRRVLRWLRPVLRWLELERVPFEGYVYGTYHREAHIAVSGEALRAELVAHGIGGERITVTGDPAHDRLRELMDRPREEVRRQVRREFGLPAEGSLLVYCTERIEEMFGDDYLCGVNAMLVRVFHDLPADGRIVVKLHPREAPSDEARYREVFSGDRFRVVRDAELAPLTRAADLVIGHFSATLRLAALLETPVLSLRIRGDLQGADGRPGGEVLSARDENELRAQVDRVLNDASFRACVRSELVRWTGRAFTAMDGRSTERVTDLVRRMLAGRSRQKKDVESTVSASSSIS